MQLLESIKELQKINLLDKVDINCIVKGLETSELLYREMKNIHEAFWNEEEKKIYAYHMKKLLVEYDCLVKVV